MKQRQLSGKFRSDLGLHFFSRCEILPFSLAFMSLERSKPSLSMSFTMRVDFNSKYQVNAYAAKITEAPTICSILISRAPCWAGYLS